MFCKNCGQEHDGGAKFCVRCGTATAAKNAPGALADVTVADKPKGTHLSGDESLNGLGGWLILVCMGLVANTILNVYHFFDGLVTYTNSNLSDYPWVQNVVLIEVIASVVFASLSAYLLFLFAKKKNLFPKMFVGFLAVAALYSFFDYSLSSTIVTVYPELDAQSTLSDLGGSVGRSVVALIVWGLYMWRSRRVRLTFTE